MNCSTPGLPVHHQLPEFTQIHVHGVGDEIQVSSCLQSFPASGSFQMSQFFESGVQSIGVSSSHEWSWELDYKESWALKNWCFGTVVLEKTLESPLDYKEIKPVNPKGKQSWIFIGRTDAEAEAPILWPPDAKNQLIRKNPDAGKDWRQEEKGMTGWDGLMTSPTRWTWVWASSRSWWSTGKSGVLQRMRSQSWIRLSNWTE